MSPMVILGILFIALIWILGLGFSEQIGEFVYKKIIDKILDIFK